MPRHASIAAVGWYNSGPQLRVYSQDARKNIVAYKWSGGWSSDGTVIGPLKFGNLFSALEWNTGSDLRLYYQADDVEIREQCQSGDEVWFRGAFISS